MATIRAYTTIEQSRKLAEILPIESADMYYTLSEDNSMYMIGFGKPHKYLLGKKQICWSLAALLDVLPYPYIEQNYKGKWTCRVEHGNTTYLWEDSNPIDACVAMIEKLHELNLL